MTLMKGSVVEQNKLSFVSTTHEGWAGRAQGTSRASMTLCDRQQGRGILIGSAYCVYSKLDIRTPHST